MKRIHKEKNLPAIQTFSTVVVVKAIKVEVERNTGRTSSPVFFGKKWH